MLDESMNAEDDLPLSRPKVGEIWDTFNNIIDTFIEKSTCFKDLDQSTLSDLSYYHHNRRVGNSFITLAIARWLFKLEPLLTEDEMTDRMKDKALFYAPLIASLPKWVKQQDYLPVTDTNTVDYHIGSHLIKSRTRKDLFLAQLLQTLRWTEQHFDRL